MYAFRCKDCREIKTSKKYDAPPEGCNSDNCTSDNFELLTKICYTDNAKDFDKRHPENDIASFTVQGKILKTGCRATSLSRNLTNCAIAVTCPKCLEFLKPVLETQESDNVEDSNEDNKDVK